MKPHFMIVQSATHQHQKRTELFLKMAEQLGRVSDYHCTLIIQSKETITSNELKHKCDIHHYEKDLSYVFPWSVSPRWRVKPKSNLVVCCDNDLLVLRDLNPFLEESFQSNAFNAMIDLVTPWKNSDCNLNADNKCLIKSGEPDDAYLTQWKRLFERMSIEFPDKLYYHTRYGKDIFADPQHALTPYYPNHGFMAMSAEVFQRVGNVYYPILKKLNDMIPKNYYIVQIAAALAIQKSGVPVIDMPMKFNYINDPEIEEPDDTVIFHYAYSREHVKTLLKSKNLHKQFVHDVLL